MIVLNVIYKCKPGMRDAFLQRLSDEGIAAASRADEGCIKYDYYVPVDDPDDLLLVEKWESAEALQKHIGQPHLALLRGIKDEYTTGTVGEKYQA